MKKGKLESQVEKYGRAAKTKVRLPQEPGPARMAKEENMRAIERIASSVFVLVIVLLGIQAHAQDAAHELTYNNQIGQIINENLSLIHI